MSRVPQWWTLALMSGPASAAGSGLLSDRASATGSGLVSGLGLGLPLASGSGLVTGRASVTLMGSELGRLLVLLCGAGWWMLRYTAGTMLDTDQTPVCRQSWRYNPNTVAPPRT